MLEGLGSKGSIQSSNEAPRPTTRSRTGCATCKQRRRKCDEGRPACTNCALSGRSCVYPPPLPLRERRHAEGGRSLPGQQTPWHVSSFSEGVIAERRAPLMPAPSVPHRSIDPFNSMVMPMPLRSQALFHYYYTVNDILLFAPSLPGSDVVATVSQDQDVLRNVLLIASWHRAWNTGSLQGFETTFHIHKVQSLQKVRGWIEDDQNRIGALKAMRAIATHCIVDCSLGNIAEARTHQKGLMSLVEHLGLGGSPPMDLQEDLTHRYAILTIMYLQSFLSRVYESQGQLSSAAMKTVSSEAVEAGVQDDWIERKRRLQTLLQIPFFIVAPGDTQPHLIDARRILDDHVKVTADAEDRIQTPATEGKDSWNRRSPVDGYEHVLEAHVGSLTTNWGIEDKLKSRKPALVDNWSALAAAIAGYTGIILGLWQRNVAKGLRLMAYLARTVRQDLLQSRQERLQWDDQHKSLWFWKAFVIALCLRLEDPDDGTDEVRMIEKQMRKCIKHWSVATGVTGWTEARKALESMVWPKYRHLEAEASSIWSASVSQPPTHWH